MIYSCVFFRLWFQFHLSIHFEKVLKGKPLLSYLVLDLISYFLILYLYACFLGFLGSLLMLQLFYP